MVSVDMRTRLDAHAVPMEPAAVSERSDPASEESP